MAGSDTDTALTCESGQPQPQPDEARSSGGLLLGRKQRRPELVEAAQGRDDCSFVCFRDFVSNGVDRASRDFWRADHSPNLTYDGILDHPCGKTLDGRRIRRGTAFDQVHRGIIAVEPRRLLGGRWRHSRAAVREDDPLQQQRCLATGMPAARIRPTSERRSFADMLSGGKGFGPDREWCMESVRVELSMGERQS